MKLPLYNTVLGQGFYSNNFNGWMDDVELRAL